MPDANEVRRTPAGWSHYLANEHEQFTLAEFTAGCLSLLLGHTMAAREAAEHTEGMVGAIDQLAAGLAERADLPYAASAKVRAAMDARRDQQRREALEGGEHASL